MLLLFCCYWMDYWGCFGDLWRSLSITTSRGRPSSTQYKNKLNRIEIQQKHIQLWNKYKQVCLVTISNPDWNLKNCRMSANFAFDTHSILIWWLRLIIKSYLILIRTLNRENMGNSSQTSGAQLQFIQQLEDRHFGEVDIYRSEEGRFIMKLKRTHISGDRRQV